jgi:hypothetical protein
MFPREQGTEGRTVGQRYRAIVAKRREQGTERRNAVHRYRAIVAKRSRY